MQNINDALFSRQNENVYVAWLNSLTENIASPLKFVFQMKNERFMKKRLDNMFSRSVGHGCILSSYDNL